MKRKSITKKIRFEVFKRDSFSCQYCGESAPEVVLHVDHINPVSKGGDNEIINLITSCESCNLGKGATKLGDSTSIKKQKDQLDILNKKREQLKMMLSWREGLKGLEDESIQAICDLWNNLLGDSEINDNGRKTLKKLLNKHSLNDILDSVEKSIDQYVSHDHTDEDLSLAFNKIGGILHSKSSPDYMKELYYIRGIARNRFNYCDDKKAIIILKDAVLCVDSSNIDDAIIDLRGIVLDSNNWTEFRDRVLCFIDKNGVK